MLIALVPDETAPKLFIDGGWIF